MLKIGPEQMKPFRAIADELFVKRVVDHLYENYADAIIKLSLGTIPVSEIGEDDLKRMVHNGISRARGYGMCSESSLAAFVALMVKVAPNFDVHPPIQQILTDDEVLPDFRIDQLLERASEPELGLAALNYDVSAWGMKRP